MIKIEKKVRWRWIPGYKGRYKVSSTGKVKSYVRYPEGKLRKLGTDSDGYCTVNLTSKTGKLKTLKVHRLVLLAFVGKPKKDQECRHLKGDRTDNRLKKLKWGTAKENSADRECHGTQTKGEQVALSKLTEKDVRRIRRRVLKANGKVSYVRLAKQYGVTAETIRNIVRNKTWKHVDGPDASGVLCDGRRLSTKKALDILNSHAEGLIQKKIAIKYGVSTPTIRAIVNRTGVWEDFGGPDVYRE